MTIRWAETIIVAQKDSYLLIGDHITILAAPIVRKKCWSGPAHTICAHRHGDFTRFDAAPSDGVIASGEYVLPFRRSCAREQERPQAGNKTTEFSDAERCF